MGLDKSGINFKAFIKGRGAEIFSLISCNPHPVRDLWGIPRHLVQILAIWNLIANGAEKIHKLLGWRKCGALLLVTRSQKTSSCSFATVWSILPAVEN